MSHFYFFSNQYPLFIYTIYWLFVCLFYLVRKEKNYYFLKLGFLIFFLMTLLGLVSGFFSQYRNISEGIFGRYLLPPYSNYIFQKITDNIQSVVISVLIAFAFYLAVFIFARKTKEEIIDAFDVALIGLGLLIIGWPNLLIFLGLIFVFALFGGVLSVLIKKKDLNSRFIITPYLPLAFLITLWLGAYFSSFIGLDKIRF